MKSAKAELAGVTIAIALTVFLSWFFVSTALGQELLKYICIFALISPLAFLAILVVVGDNR